MKPRTIAPELTLLEAQQLRAAVRTLPFTGPEARALKRAKRKLEAALAQESESRSRSSGYTPPKKEVHAMARIHSIVVLDEKTEVAASGSDDGEHLYLALAIPPDALTIAIPYGDADAALFLDHLSAAISNLESLVELRRQRRERAHPGEEIIGEVPGWNGAGASVEAQRG